MRQSILFAALSAVAAVVAQNQNFTIDISKVSPSTKSAWCNAQFNSCGALCFGSLKKNDCQASDLTYECVCSNGTAPGLDYYLQTIPTFICNEAFSQCTQERQGGSAAELKKCTTDIRDNCGTLDTADAKPEGSDDSDDKATTTGPSGTQGAAETNAPSTSTSQAAAPTNFAQIGNGVAAVAAGVFAAALL
ncbi:hypothetical protein QBC40DRAFT_344795 [Triangularia verruculosa]|uniref:DUF7707 domain-containing protein n=1 Tax=Triangularia verruculosa TaxID=2587418 RepID=A0AAN6XR06_9PEZI|nr:hypothetical protein QBC40DRAFT_344795 [Triangularia verruculosa]